MSILDRIGQRKAENVQGVYDMQQEEANAPEEVDAVAEAGKQRQSHRQEFANGEDRDLQEEQAGPGEQRLHQKVEQEMIAMVNSSRSGSTEALLKAVMTAEDPTQGVGTVAADLVAKLKQNNPDMTDDVMFSIGERTVEELVELVEMANPRINMSEDDMGEALSIGLESFMVANPDEVDNAGMQEFMSNGE